MLVYDIMYLYMIYGTIIWGVSKKTCSNYIRMYKLDLDGFAVVWLDTNKECEKYINGYGYFCC